MIPILVERGHRVIAPDLVGFGRSDKPVDRDAYSYANLVRWTGGLLFEGLDLENIMLFAQDWGGLIGLRLVAEHPDRFARVVAANTGLPTGEETFSDAFLEWQRLSQEVEELPIARILQSATVDSLPPDVLRAYEAPFPDERYKADARMLPVLVPTSPDDPAAEANRAAWQVLSKFEKPLLTLFGDSDPVTAGAEKALQRRIPGARGQPHAILEDAGHFIQEDRGEELARRVHAFIERTRSGND